MLQTRQLASADAGNVSFEIDYDDATLLIQTARLINTGARGTVTITLTNPANGNVVFGPISRTVGDATLTQDVSNRNIHMVAVTDHHGNAGLATPFNVSLEWVNTAARVQH
jgi:hypothetical protein